MTQLTTTTTKPTTTETLTTTETTTKVNECSSANVKVISEIQILCAAIDYAVDTFPNSTTTTPDLTTVESEEDRIQKLFLNLQDLLREHSRIDSEKQENQTDELKEELREVRNQLQQELQKNNLDRDELNYEQMEKQQNHTQALLDQLAKVENELQLVKAQDLVNESERQLDHLRQEQQNQSQLLQQQLERLQLEQLKRSEQLQQEQLNQTKQLHEHLEQQQQEQQNQTQKLQTQLQLLLENQLDLQQKIQILLPTEAPTTMETAPMDQTENTTFECNATAVGVRNTTKFIFKSIYNKTRIVSGKVEVVESPNGKYIGMAFMTLMVGQVALMVAMDFFTIWSQVQTCLANVKPPDPNAIISL